MKQDKVKGAITATGTQLTVLGDKMEQLDPSSHEVEREALQQFEEQHKALEHHARC